MRLNPSENALSYASPSRFTDPKDLSYMLDELPDTVEEVCAAASQQVIHHNLLGHFGIKYEQRAEMTRVWPPDLQRVLAELQRAPPHNLTGRRPPKYRVIGACILESHLLAGFLRHRSFKVRVRVGYFRNVENNLPLTTRFWLNALAARGVDLKRLREDSRGWEREVRELTAKQFAIRHRIEHWICECFSERTGSWTLLDADKVFLKAHSGITVPFALPSKYFIGASDAWKEMRTTADFDSDRYAEEPQDGRSHIRSQMLSDFFSLLNHDVAGQGESARSLSFIKERSYDDLSQSELKDLDRLAELLSGNPGVDDLLTFYHDSDTIALPDAEEDPYCFLSGERHATR